jgi:hypothetical protein
MSGVLMIGCPQHMMHYVAFQSFDKFIGKRINIFNKYNYLTTALDTCNNP